MGRGVISVLWWVFAASVVAYFTTRWADINNHTFDCITKTLPVALLSYICYLAARRPFAPLSIALALSAAGDWAGEEHKFILQIALFAVAHIFFAVHFLRSTRFDTKALLGTLAVAIVCAILGWRIVPAISDSTIQIACSSYIFIIGIMASSTMVHRSPLRPWYIVAAALFVISDSTIAWNRFVERIPYAGMIIMSTYFAAQYLFARLYVKESLRKA